MAQIQEVPGKRGRKKAMPYVDLTPMVDLGFILITFFLFTTTLMEAKSLVLNMPVPSTEHPTKIPEESTITLIPTASHKVAYYTGTLGDDGVAMTSHTGNALRNLLVQQIKRAAALPSSYSADAHKLHVVIKPDDLSSYDDVVRILDEMIINNVPYYVIADITAGERKALAGIR